MVQPLYATHPSISLITSFQRAPRLACLWVHGLLEADAKLFPQRLQLLQILLVLAVVLDLRLDACSSVLALVLLGPLQSLCYDDVTHPRKS
jgi:hypothetical protein